MGPLFLAVVLITGSINVLAIDYISVGSGKTCERNGAIVVYDHISTRFECFSGFQTSTSNTDVAVIRRGTEIRKSKYSTVTGSEEAKCADNYVMVGWEKDKIVCRQMIGIKTDGCDYSSRFYRPTSTYGNFGMWYVGKNYRQIVNGFKITHYKAKVLVGVYICKVCSEHAKWTPWSSWGSCSRYCKEEMRGTYFGTRSKTRSCNSQNNIRVVCQANKCPGDNRQPDSNKCCPARIDGGWSCWSGWSKCSATCGVGTRTRQRHCNNPSPTKYGYCVGNAIETKACNTAQYKPIQSSGIARTSDNGITTSLADCMKRCTNLLTPLPCYSFEYRTSNKRCILNNKHKASPATGGKFKGSTYYQRKCKPNNEEKIQQRSVSVFSDGCHTSNCYSTCGESEYVNKVIGEKEIVLRFIQFDLSELPGKLSGRKPTKVTVYAQTVVLNQKLSIDYDLVIVARQVHMNNKIPAAFGFSNSKRDFNKCYEDSIQLDCSINVPMKLVSYYETGDQHRIDIFAEGINTERNCIKGKRLVTETPNFDGISLKLAMTCAEDLVATSTPDKTGKFQIAKNIVSYMWHVSKHPTGFSSQSEALSVQSAATSLYDYIKLRETGKHNVPILSQSAYTNMLNRYSTIFRVYHDRFDNIYSTNTDLDVRMADLAATVGQSKDAKRLQTKTFEFAKQQVDESEESLKKLTHEFGQAASALEDAQKTFEKGIEDDKTQSISRTVFEVVQVIGQVIQVSAGVAGAKGSDLKGIEKDVEMINAITDLVTTAANLATMLADMKGIVEKIGSVKSISEDVSKAVKSRTTPGNAADIMKRLEATATVRVQIVVWENLKNVGQTQLTGNKVAGVSGATEYHKALADIADWGKALSEQTLHHAKVMSKYLVESIANDNAKQTADLMQGLYDSAVKSRKVSNALLTEVSMDVIDLQRAAMRLVHDFCRSYFYYNLDKCTSGRYLHLSYSITETRKKLAELAIMTLEAARRFGTKTPSPFNAHVVLTDKAVNDCRNPIDCPVSTIKKSKKLLLDIPFSAPNLKGLDRVRLDEIRVFINGVGFKGNDKIVKVYLNNLGEIKDRYAGTKYTFTSTSRDIIFSFDYSANVIYRFGCLHSSMSKRYHSLTPFGKWIIEIYDPANQLDLSKMNRVEIYFLGSAIRSKDQHRSSVPGNKFTRYGAASRSVQCTGSGPSNKRSIRF